jgi:hypothetical protein
LIERAKLFGNPSKIGGRISPDGQWLSWIAPRDGVLNIWVAPVGDLAQARPLTAETQRPIRSTSWAPDSNTVLYINDRGGDQNFLLYGVDIASGALKNYTPFDKTRVQIVHISRSVKERILVGINNRDQRWHDVHSLDLVNGKLTLVQQNDAYGGFLADDSLVLRVAEESRPDGGTDYFRLAEGQAEGRPFVSVDLEDSLTTAPLAFTADGKTLYWTDSPRPQHGGTHRARLRQRHYHGSRPRCACRHQLRPVRPEYRQGAGVHGGLPQERVRSSGSGRYGRPAAAQARHAWAILSRLTQQR